MRIIFLGPPGVGKGTYASRIGPELHIPQISTGDLVRKEMASGSERGQKLQSFHDKGMLVPDNMITEMLKKRLTEEDAEAGFILDGYPRTLKQAELLEGITAIDVVVNIQLPEHIILKKLAARRVCKKCGAIYNLVAVKEDGIDLPNLPPKQDGICDDCGGGLLHRKDDKEDVLEERLAIYSKQTKPLVEYYKKKGILRDFHVTGGPGDMVPKIVELIKNK